ACAKRRRRDSCDLESSRRWPAASWGSLASRDARRKRGPAGRPGRWGPSLGSRRAGLTPHRRSHCWTETVTALSRRATPVDRCTNAAGIRSGAEPVAAALPTKASQLLAPGVGTLGHPPAGWLLKMITALAPASCARWILA